MFNTLLKLATDNPGQYIPAGGTVSSVNSPIFWVGMVVGLIVLAACMSIASDNGEPGAAVIGVVLYAGIVAAAMYFAQQHLDEQTRDEPRGVSAAEYDQSVTDWLNETYGIHVSSEDAANLRTGESLAVEFNGESVVIEFVKTADSEDLAVRATGGQLLTPLATAE